MKKTILCCDRCEREIKDGRTAAKLSLYKGGRRTGIEPLDLCAKCKHELERWLRPTA